MNPSDVRQNRLRLRTAFRIHDQLASVSCRVELRSQSESWQELEQAARKLALARERNWTVAARHARRDYHRLLRQCCDELAERCRQLEGEERPRVVPSIREIDRELQALEDEFPEVELSLREKSLSVTTDAIELEGVDLGRFRIVLNWDELPGSPSYEVIALDPHPAGSDPSTTHPHVRDEGLCEGEGRMPIVRALADGRLFDFFLLVRQILKTYNPGSAYVPLSRWQGASCSDCGYLASADDSTSCDRCDCDLCYDCHVSCSNCGRSCCGDCRERCPGCDETYCSVCLRSCTDCDESRCRGCLTHGRCGDCHQFHEESDAHDQETANENANAEPETSELPAGATTLTPV